jgi:Tfp pilus assembly protein PilF
MIYLSPFLLLLISTVVGIWGFMKRSILMENIMDFEHAGSFIYIGLGIITLATCGFAFATANDPMVEVLEDAVTYTHLAMGVMFVGYVMTNFLTLFKEGLPIHKIVFKPLNLPLWLFRVLAVISIAALLVLKGFYPVQQSFTAYYNQLGDYYTVEEDYKFAEVEYKLALAYEYRNHKTNYALASLSLKQGDNESAAVYFRRALAKNPSVFAYEGLSRSFYDTDHFFESMFTLKEGLQKFPNSGELQNNLAYLYNKSNVLDSTVVMYELALKNAVKSDVPAANLVAFWATNGKKTTIQEILDKVENRPYNTYQANILALKNLQAKATTTNVKAWEGKLSADSMLNVSDFAWIYNQTIFQKSVGKALPLKRLSELEDNESLTEDLLFANVIQEYYKGEKLLTFQNLQAWAVGDSADKKGKYYQLLLNTLLKKELYDNAPQNLMTAVDVNQITPIVNQHPLNELVVEKAVAIYNKAKQPEKAYQIVLNALAWRKNSPKLYEIFIGQALTIGMKDYAAEGLTTLQKLSPTDYQRFLPTYQARIQSIEKAGAGFQ